MSDKAQTIRGCAVRTQDGELKRRAECWMHGIIQLLYQ